MKRCDMDQRRDKSKMKKMRQTNRENTTNNNNNNNDKNKLCVASKIAKVHSMVTWQAYLKLFRDCFRPDRRIFFAARSLSTPNLHQTRKIISKMYFSCFIFIYAFVD
jgi:D-alanyl-D-alanine dipeptidase